MSAPTSSSTTRACPSCGEPGTGRFCAACGASLGGATCAGCAAPLDAGAKFCHRCGRPVGAGAPPVVAAPPADRMSTVLPWAVAFVALLALAAMAAGRNFNRAPSSETASAPSADAAGAPSAGGRPPNLANMSPREIADRLFDRVMLMASQGKADSAAFFAGMAIQNYESMGALDLDLRYDMGRVAEVAGRRDVVQAQADSILAENPTHLLGLVLAIKAAALASDAKALSTYNGRLLAAIRAGERERPIEEYTRHAADIDAAIAAANGPSK